MTGLKSVVSNFSVMETENRFIKRIEENGVQVCARIHSVKQLLKKGHKPRPTPAVMFRNPKPNTLLMQEKQYAAFNLPVSTLLWKDAKGNDQVAFNTMSWKEERHGLPDDLTLKKINRILENLGDYASKSNLN